MATPSAIAVILARAGSKGVPGKNIAPIAGKPCIAWTIEYALACSQLALVAVSTDEPRIVDLVRSRYSRVAVVVRPGELATDTARVDDAARHAVKELERERPELRGEETRVVVLYGNVPVRPAGLIDAALARMSPGTDSVQSFSAVGKNHPWWMCRIAEDGAVSPWEGDVMYHGVYRRQELPAAYVPDGAVMVVRRKALDLQVAGVAAGPHAFFGKVRRGVVSGGEAVDIDTPRDVMVAEAILSGRVSA